MKTVNGILKTFVTLSELISNSDFRNQIRLADHLGITSGRISNFKARRDVLGNGVLARMAEALEVSVEEVLKSRDTEFEMTTPRAGSEEMRDAQPTVDLRSLESEVRQIIESFGPNDAQALNYLEKLLGDGREAAGAAKAAAFIREFKRQQGQKLKRTRT